MRENIVIPYNDKANEIIYSVYRDFIDWFTSQVGQMTYTRLYEEAIRITIDQLIITNSYCKFYTIRQVEHIAELMATAYIKGQKQLYIF